MEPGSLLGVCRWHGNHHNISARCRILSYMSIFPWLYVSPARSATPTHKNTSPYKWVRQDFEKSSPEVDSTRQSLLLKLDECSRGYSSIYSPNVSRESNDHIASLSPIEEARPPSPTIPQIKQQLRDIRTITGEYCHAKKHCAFL
uniref:Uncharacterized protein n=1 Tax=Branchiostoma floridae TaxID=7739 RepID=C3YSA2_BRAFL|eukprot:XP_002600995.1 hypothetical protein BRAFLDRAFT_96965 [Branchiostoma floridae]